MTFSRADHLVRRDDTARMAAGAAGLPVDAAVLVTIRAHPNPPGPTLADALQEPGRAVQLRGETDRAIGHLGEALAHRGLLFDQQPHPDQLQQPPQHPKTLRAATLDRR